MQDQFSELNCGPPTPGHLPHPDAPGWRVGEGIWPPDGEVGDMTPGHLPPPDAPRGQSSFSAFGGVGQISGHLPCSNAPSVRGQLEDSRSDSNGTATLSIQLPNRRGVKAMENEVGQPLGYCDECDRMRWLAVVTRGNEAGQTPHGTCNTCARVAAEAAAAFAQE